VYCIRMGEEVCKQPEKVVSEWGWLWDQPHCTGWEVGSEHYDVKLNKITQKRIHFIHIFTLLFRYSIYNIIFISIYM
jgi:hypothetical protein